MRAILESPNWAKYQRYIYTFILICGEISYGMICAMYAPIMVDMKYILNTTMRWVSMFTTFETTGYCLGTFTMAFLFRYLNRQLTMSVFFILLTIAAASIPLVPQVWVLFVCAFVLGFSSTIFSSSNCVWAIELWRDVKVPIVQILSVGFSIGNVLCTVSLRPYLVGEQRNGGNDEKLEIDINEVTERRNRLMFPTLIIGGCLMIVPVMHWIMYFISPYKPPKEKSDDIETEDDKIDETDSTVKAPVVKIFDRKQSPKITIRLIFAAFFGLSVIFETVYMKFTVTYLQYTALHLSANDAAYMFSISSAMLTVGMVLNIFWQYRFPIRLVLVGHYLVSILGTVLLIPGQYNIVCQWLACIFIPLGASGFFGGIIWMIEQYMNITNTTNAIFRLSKGIITLVTPLIIGPYIEKHSSIFIYTELFYLSSSITLFIILNLAIKKYSSKLENNNNNNNNTHNDNNNVSKTNDTNNTINITTNVKVIN